MLACIVVLPGAIGLAVDGGLREEEGESEVEEIFGIMVSERTRDGRSCNSAAIRVFSAPKNMINLYSQFIDYYTVVILRSYKILHEWHTGNTNSHRDMLHCAQVRNQKLIC